MRTIQNVTKIIFCSIIICFFISCNTNSQTSISVLEFKLAIEKPDIQLLDVRTSEEYESGHLVNALLADWNKAEEFDYRIAALDKQKPTFVYCLSGARSTDAMAYLLKNGFTNVQQMKGGINAWNQANFITESNQTIAQMSRESYFKQIQGNETYLVDFGAKWCAPCKKMAPIIAQLEKESNNKYKIVQIDGGVQKDICKQLHIIQFPTFIIYKNGVEVSRVSGLQLKDALKKMLE
jgi:thioredoxin